MTTEGISAVLPAFNEEANVEHAVAQALETLAGLTATYEVIVVDDGSVDGTAAVAGRLVTASHGHVRLLRHHANRGYGAALRTGFGAARFGLIFFTDCDNQFDIAELRYFLPQMEDYDVMTGFRVYRYDTVVRSMLSWIYNRLVAVVFRVGVRDVDCAFKLFRREVLEQISAESDNFFISTELLARARKWNFRIGEKGVRHFPRTAGETTVRASDIPRTLREVIRMWRRIYLPTRGQKRDMLLTEPGADYDEFMPDGARAHPG